MVYFPTCVSLGRATASRIDPDTSGYHPDTFYGMYPDCIRMYPYVSACIRIPGDTPGYIRIPSGYILWYVSGWYPDVSGSIPLYVHVL